MSNISEDNNTRAETSGSEDQKQELEVKHEIEKEVPLDQIPSLYGNAKWYQKIFFGWSFPIIKIGNERKIKYADLGGLQPEDFIQTKVEKVKKIYET